MKYYLNNSYSFLQGIDECGDNFLCPQRLYIDITEDCNLFCKMCRSKISISGKTMSMNLFKKIIEETSPFVKCYSLFNWGEPLLVKDFRERVQFLNNKKRNDCIVEISTNGILLSDKILNFLFDEKVKITISFDGSDKNTFENIRCGSNFEQIINNAKNAALKYKDFPIEHSPEFYISVQKENQNDVLNIVKLAHNLGIRRIGLGVVSAPDKYSPNNPKKLCSELEQTYNYIHKNNMFLSVFPTKVGNYVFTGEKYYNEEDFLINTVCNAPFVSASIAYNGDVYLCCNIGEYVGSIKDGSFLELWQSQKYNKLRKLVNDKENMPEKCINCAWFNRN